MVFSLLTLRLVVAATAATALAPRSTGLVSTHRASPRATSRPVHSVSKATLTPSTSDDQHVISGIRDRRRHNTAGEQRRAVLTQGLAVAVGVFVVPTWCRADEDLSETVEPRQCNENLYAILRVQEATQQESRLVKTGKFKDLQRANIKLAVNLILKNYALLDNLLAASTLATGAKSFEASQAGREAVEALQQVLEYFDSSARSLSVETLGGEKLDFVLRALVAADDNLDRFLGYMPEDEVRKARAVVDRENAKNFDEFKKANPDQPAYLNPAPSGTKFA